ncbi:hypothetical protein [Microbacterium sp. P5_E9]
MTGLVPLPSDGGFHTHEPVRLRPDYAPAGMSPEIAYSLACHLVRTEHNGGITEKVRSLLTIAFLDEELRRWAMTDPELKRVRSVPGQPKEVSLKFRELVGMADAPTVTPAAKQLFALACQVDPFDGLAAAASNALAALAAPEQDDHARRGCFQLRTKVVPPKPVTVDDLKELRGSQNWSIIERSIWRTLHDTYGFAGDPLRVHTWLARIMGAEGPDPALSPPKAKEADKPDPDKADPAKSGSEKADDGKSGAEKPGAEKPDDGKSGAEKADGQKADEAKTD